MSTVHVKASRNAAVLVEYLVWGRGPTGRAHRSAGTDRVAAMVCEHPDGPEAFARYARVVTSAHRRPVEVLHYRQGFNSVELSPTEPDDVQSVADTGYLLAKRMHPNSAVLVVVHIDGVGGHPHAHIVVVNHDDANNRALKHYRTFHDRPDQGGQKGLKSVNDDLMRELGYSVVADAPAEVMDDWELRRGSFGDGSLDQELGDRVYAALRDHRSVDEQAYRQVLGEHEVELRASAKDPSGWTYAMRDERGDRPRMRRRKASRLSSEFTHAGAHEIFKLRKEQDREHQERTVRRSPGGTSRSGRIIRPSVGSGKRPADEQGDTQYAGHGNEPPRTWTAPIPRTADSRSRGGGSADTDSFAEGVGAERSATTDRTLAATRATIRSHLHRRDAEDAECERGEVDRTERRNERHPVGTDAGNGPRHTATAGHPADIDVPTAAESLFGLDLAAESDAEAHEFGG